MSRIGSTFWFAAVTLALVAFGLAGASPASAWHGPSVLSVGQSWREVSFAQSPSGEFALHEYVTGLDLWQYIDTGGQSLGTDVWQSRPRSNGHCAQQPALTMEATGEAVLHCGTQRLWATPTRGTGSANSFRIRDSGMLVVTTAGGRVVWRSHSGRALMGTGHTLQAGQWLRDCSLILGPCPTLTMRRDGDLALTYGVRIDWQSDTHNPGSRLVLRRSGALQVIGPAGHVLWRSHTGGFGIATYLEVESNAGGNGPLLTIGSLQHPSLHWYRG